MNSIRIGFAEVLAVAFIVLKLCNVIDWSWLWVLCPIWISIILRAIISVAVDKLFTDNFNI